jgi:hypothetical protein
MIFSPYNGLPLFFVIKDNSESRDLSRDQRAKDQIKGSRSESSVSCRVGSCCFDPLLDLILCSYPISL